MYSSTELCGSADLLRRFIQQAAGGFGAGAVAADATRSLNSGTTANLPEAAQRAEARSAPAPEISSCFAPGVETGSHELDALWQHRTPVVGWHHRPLSAAARSASVLQPMPMRPVLPEQGIQMAHSAPAPCLAPAVDAAAHALSDRTNRQPQPAVDPSEPEFDYGTDDDGTEAMHGSYSTMLSDPLRRFSSTGVSSAFSADLAERMLGPELCNLRTLSSQDSAWSGLVPRRVHLNASCSCCVTALHVFGSGTRMIGAVCSRRSLKSKG